MPDRVLIRDDGAVFCWTEVLALRADMKEGVVESILDKHMAALAKAHAKQREAKMKKLAAQAASPQPISDKP